MKHAASGATWVLCCMLLIGCEEEKHRPQGLLPKEKMVKVLTDAHLVETARNLKVTPNDTIYQEHFASIFEAHGVSRTDFDSSLWYYSTQAQNMDSIYELVMEHLSELDAKVKSASSSPDRP